MVKDNDEQIEKAKELIRSDIEQDHIND